MADPKRAAKALQQIVDYLGDLVEGVHVDAEEGDAFLSDSMTTNDDITGIASTTLLDLRPELGDGSVPTAPAAAPVVSRQVNANIIDMSAYTRPADFATFTVEVSENGGSFTTLVVTGSTAAIHSPLNDYTKTYSYRYSVQDHEDNEAGPSPASDAVLPRKAGEGGVNDIEAGSISADLLTSEFVLANRIFLQQEGSAQRIELDSLSGIILYPETGDPLLVLPTTAGQLPTFRGTILADGGIIATGAISFYNLDNQMVAGSRLLLGDSTVVDPSTAASLQLAVATDLFENWTAVAPHRGLDYHPAAGASADEKYITVEGVEGGRFVLIDADKASLTYLDMVETGGSLAGHTPLGACFNRAGTDTIVVLSKTVNDYFLTSYDITTLAQTAQTDITQNLYAIDGSTVKGIASSADKLYVLEVKDDIGDLVAGWARFNGTTKAFEAHVLTDLNCTTYGIADLAYRSTDTSMFLTRKNIATGATDVAAYDIADGDELPETKFILLGIGHQDTSGLAWRYEDNAVADDTFLAIDRNTPGFSTHPPQFIETPETDKLFVKYNYFEGALGAITGQTKLTSTSSSMVVKFLRRNHLVVDVPALPEGADGTEFWAVLTPSATPADSTYEKQAEVLTNSADLLNYITSDAAVPPTANNMTTGAAATIEGQNGLLFRGSGVLGLGSFDADTVPNAAGDKQSGDMFWRTTENLAGTPVSGRLRWYNSEKAQWESPVVAMDAKEVFVSASQSRTNVAFGALATDGPKVWILCPPSGRFLVLGTCTCDAASAGNLAAFGVQIVHATGDGSDAFGAQGEVVAAAVSNGAENWSGRTVTIARSNIISGRTPGEWYRARMLYRSSAGVQATFSDRQLVVVPL